MDNERSVSPESDGRTLLFQKQRTPRRRSVDPQLRTPQSPENQADRSFVPRSKRLNRAPAFRSTLFAPADRSLGGYFGATALEDERMKTKAVAVTTARRACGAHLCARGGRGPVVGDEKELGRRAAVVGGRRGAGCNQVRLYN